MCTLARDADFYFFKSPSSCTPHVSTSYVDLVSSQPTPELIRLDLITNLTSSPITTYFQDSARISSALRSLPRVSQSELIFPFWTLNIPYLYLALSATCLLGCESPVCVFPRIANSWVLGRRTLLGLPLQPFLRPGSRHLITPYLGTQQSGLFLQVLSVIVGFHLTAGSGQ